MHHLCKLFHCPPNSPKIQELDDITMNWLYYSWLEDETEELKKMKTFGCFVGSFSNMELAKHIEQSDDDDNKVSVSDEEFEAAWDFVQKSDINVEPKKKKRRVKLR